MWGILTFFIPSQLSSSLEFLKLFGTSYFLGIVEIGSLHLGSGEMISGKIQIQKYEKFHKSMKNMRNPHIFVPFQFSTSLEFLKFWGTSYGLDIV